MSHLVSYPKTFERAHRRRRGIDLRDTAPPGTAAVLATGGGLIFHGDINRRFRAFDADTGAQLWETILGGNPSVSTISYRVNGRQYVAVMTGNTMKVPGELSAMAPEITVPSAHNAIYVFALPGA